MAFVCSFLTIGALLCLTDSIYTSISNSIINTRKRMTPDEIKEVRGQLTQQEFATKIGYSIGVVQSLEQGRVNASPRAIKAIRGAK